MNFLLIAYRKQNNTDNCEWKSWRGKEVSWESKALTLFWCETLMQNSQLKLWKIFTGHIFSHVFQKIYQKFWKAANWIQVGEVNCFVSHLIF